MDHMPTSSMWSDIWIIIPTCRISSNNWLMQLLSFCAFFLMEILFPNSQSNFLFSASQNQMCECLSPPSSCFSFQISSPSNHCFPLVIPKIKSVVPQSPQSTSCQLPWCAYHAYDTSLQNLTKLKFHQDI